jgi:hypothetical protein
LPVSSQKQRRGSGQPFFNSPKPSATGPAFHLAPPDVFNFNVAAETSTAGTGQRHTLGMDAQGQVTGDDVAFTPVAFVP